MLRDAGWGNSFFRLSAIALDHCDIALMQCCSPRVVACGLVATFIETVTRSMLREIFRLFPIRFCINYKRNKITFTKTLLLRLDKTIKNPGRKIVGKIAWRIKRKYTVMPLCHGLDRQRKGKKIDKQIQLRTKQIKQNHVQHWRDYTLDMSWEKKVNMQITVNWAWLYFI